MQIFIPHLPHHTAATPPIAPPLPSPHLRITKIHLRVLSLKLLQHIHLLRLLARRLPHLLLPLIIHHLLHHSPRFPVQIPQFRILGRDFGGVEEVGRVGGDGGPPLLLVGFVEVDGDFFGGGGRGFERPGGFGGVDFVGEGALRSVVVVSIR